MKENSAIGKGKCVVANVAGAIVEPIKEKITSLFRIGERDYIGHNNFFPIYGSVFVCPTISFGVRQRAAVSDKP
jgi:hypothetical protein